eukprot:TRINITY_DN1586_c0_g1_i4.p3 TRINITY_DN1586_c0_g1~~TRINITY_DN1586_c0_g1_i4.p3  ORF type:complete len:149 (+),score=22.07 TRINITY_DN1586_c0_g1_i4:463-909(+)
MQFQASKHLKLLLFFILSLHFQSLVTAEEVFKTLFFCGSSNYTSGSQYDTNLNIILPTLSRNGVIRHDSFYNNSYGDGANTVYGYSQCMSGASEDVCRQCFVNSTADIIRLCPDWPVAVAEDRQRRLLLQMDRASKVAANCRRTRLGF